MGATPVLALCRQAGEGRHGSILAAGDHKGPPYYTGQCGRAPLVREDRRDQHDVGGA